MYLGSQFEMRFQIIKFIYSENATKFCEIFTVLLSYVVPVKSKGKILQNLVAFSEYMNFEKFKIWLRKWGDEENNPPNHPPFPDGSEVPTFSTQ